MRKAEKRKAKKRKKKKREDGVEGRGQTNSDTKAGTNLLDHVLGNGRGHLVVHFTKSWHLLACFAAHTDTHMG